jgi:hybrid cluster-associated redox disulfide protein
MMIGAHSVVGILLREHPETLSVFLRNRMHCPGCVMARFVTVAEAAASYRVGVDGLIEELRAAVAGTVAEAVR